MPLAIMAVMLLLLTSTVGHTAQSRDIEWVSIQQGHSTWDACPTTRAAPTKSGRGTR